MALGWNELLSAAGRREAGALVGELDHLGLIAARGGDAAPFLDAMLTCDLATPDPDRAPLCACCDARGRMLACPRLVVRPGEILLSLPAALVAATLAHLGRHVLRARVSLEDSSGRLGQLGVMGPEAEPLVCALAGPVPEAAGGARHRDGLSVVRLPGEVPRFLLVAPGERIGAIGRGLAGGAVRAGAELWRLADILSGLPAVYPQTRGAFLPQMANLDLLGGVSFRKGCYPGQEVIARTQHLGRLKRRMFLARGAAGAAPAAPVYAGGAEPIGQVADAAPLGGGSALLAVLAIDRAGGAGLHLGRPGGPELELLDLPYPLS